MTPQIVNYIPPVMAPVNPLDRTLATTDFSAAGRHTNLNLPDIPTVPSGPLTRSIVSTIYADQLLAMKVSNKMETCAALAGLMNHLTYYNPASGHCLYVLLESYVAACIAEIAKGA